LLGGVARTLDVKLLPLVGDLAADDVADAEDGFHQLRTLCADQTADAQDLSLSQLKRNILEGLRIDGREVFDLQHDLSRNVLALREAVGHLTADHLLDDHVRGQILGLIGADIGAVTHDRDFIGDLQDLLHLMRDIDNRYAVCLQLVDDHEQVGDFILSQR